MRQISFFRACAALVAAFGLWTMVLQMSLSVKSHCYMKTECSGNVRSGNSSECTFSPDFLHQTKWSGSEYKIFKRTGNPQLIQSYSIVYSSEVRNEVERVVLEFGMVHNTTCMLYTSDDTDGFQVKMKSSALTVKHPFHFPGIVFGLAIDCEGLIDWLFLSDDNSSITVKLNETTYICYNCVSPDNACNIAFMHTHG